MVCGYKYTICTIVVCLKLNGVFLVVFIGLHKLSFVYIINYVNNDHPLKDTQRGYLLSLIHYVI